jgi:hypothetical protein
VQVLAPARQLAEVLADTEFVPKPMRGKPDVVCAAIMYGDELGLGPMQALAGIDVVEGKPRPSAELCRALIMREGHTLTVHDMTGQRCRVSGLRAGKPESERVVVEWNHDMARAAGLTSKANWRSYPRAMLLARATSDLARLLFPDVVKGLGYIAEDGDSAAVLEAWGPSATEDAPTAPAVARKRPQRRTPARLPSPGHTLATEARPGPDGSVDVPLPPMPEPEPEPAAVELPPEIPEPDSEPEASPKLIGAAPLKAVNTKLGTILGRPDRADRLGALSAVVGRELDSSTELTREEGYRVLGALTRVDAGLAGVRQADDGTWVYESYEAPPPGEDDDPWGAPPQGELPDMPEPPGNSGRDRA